jgi:hypothetical protein
MFDDLIAKSVEYLEIGNTFKAVEYLELAKKYPLGLPEMRLLRELAESIQKEMGIQFKTLKIAQGF